MTIKIKFRGLNAALVSTVAETFADCPEWDVQQGDIFTGTPADILVSPANCTGRMDGGIDQVYINRFGWQLEARLMRDIKALHGGKLPIGQARLITTYDLEIPLMVSAPTMDWPPGDVSNTQNAYFAFAAVLRVAATEGVRAIGRAPIILMPGLCTLTGRMPAHVFAAQARRAWDEFKRLDTALTAGIDVQEDRLEIGTPISAHHLNTVQEEIAGVLPSLSQSPFALTAAWLSQLGAGAMPSQPDRNIASRLHGGLDYSAAPLAGYLITEEGGQFVDFVMPEDMEGIAAYLGADGVTVTEVVERKFFQGGNAK